MNNSIRETRVLHIITSLKQGGAETMLFKLLSCRTDGKSHSMVLSLTGDGIYADKIRSFGIQVVFMNLKNPTRSLLEFRRILMQIKSFKPNIIQAWMYHSNLFSLFFRLVIRTTTPIIWNIRHSLHGWSNKKLFIRLVIMLNKLFSSKPSTIVYNSKTSRYQHEAIGFSTDHAITIPNGFDYNIYLPNIHVRNTVRSKYSVLQNEILIGHVGRYHPIKGHANFIKSLALLHGMAPSINWRTIMIGKDITDDNIELSEIIHKHNLENKIILAGESYDVQNIYPAMDVFCLSSISEAFPNVLGEAMLCQIPCVSTDVGDASDIIGSTGIILPSLDPASMAEALYKICSASHLERDSLGISARERIMINYSINNIHNQYETLYRKILAR